MEVIKRDGSTVEFNKEKIKEAISKAFGLINIGFEKEGKVIFAVVHAEHLWYTVDRSFQKPANAAKAAQNQTFRKD